MIGLVPLQVLFSLTSWAAAHQLLARGQGCSEIPTHTYSINNSTFTIICNTTWDGSLYLNVLYTPNFASCLQACVDWADETPCVGAQWDYSSPGYDGGYLCHLLWSMPPNNSTAATFKSEVDSAQLNPGPPPIDNCLELQSNGNTYTAFGGEIFDLFCYTEFDFNDLELLYTADLESCAQQCLLYNANPRSTKACVGISFDWQKHGASPANLSQCWPKYSMEGSGSNRTQAVHSMKLRPQFIHITGSANGTTNNVPSVTVTTTSGFTKPSGIGGIVGGIFGGIVIGCLITGLFFYSRNRIKYITHPGGGVPRSGSMRSGLPPLTPIN